MKKCKICLVEKSFDQFYKNKKSKDGYGGWCSQCHKAYSRNRYASNPEPARKYASNWRVNNYEQHRKNVKRWQDENADRLAFLNFKSSILRKYGLSYESYVKLLDQHGNACAICKSSEKLCIDHDHECCPSSRTCGKCVRGILCNSCNTMLGMCNDKVEVLKNAIEYLDVYGKSSKKST